MSQTAIDLYESNTIYPELMSLYSELKNTSDTHFRDKAITLIKIARLEALNHNEFLARELLYDAKHLATQSSDTSLMRLVEVRSAKITIQHNLSI